MSLHAILSQQGSLYVHIDCKVGHYLKIVLDEIFGQKCFVNDITRIKCNPKNFSRKGFGNLKDMVLFYSKSDKPYWKGSRETMSDCDIERLFPKMDKQGRRYTTTPLHAPGETAQGPTGKPWKGMRPPRGRHWRYPPVELDRLDKMGLIEWSSTGNPRKIIYAETAIQNGKKRQDIWEFKDPPNPSYPTEKNLAMIQMIVEASSEPGGLVLDCFAGSGTTAVAAESCGRRWIMIDNSEAAIDTMIERIHRLPSPKPFILFETIVP